MGERRWSAWRRLAGSLPARRRAERCRASGWGLRESCTDGEGTTVCPVCSRRVHTEAGPAAGQPVRMVGEHAP
jgi:hypothetical protein